MLQSQASGNKLSSVQCGIRSTHESRTSAGTVFFFSRLVHCLLPFVPNFDPLCFVLCAVREELMNFRDALQIGDGDDSDGVVGIASRLFVVCFVAFLHI